MNISFCVDDNFSVPLAASINSIVKNTPKNKYLNIYIVGDISYDKKRRLRRVSGTRVNTNFLDSPQLPVRAEKLNSKDHITRPAYYRVLLPHILPTHFSKVIYLDVDTIVNGNMNFLWEQDMGNNIILACRDPEIFKINNSDIPKSFQKKKKIGDFKYFNSGVLVIDIGMWKDSNITRKFFEYVVCYGSGKLADQDGLNAVLYNKWGEIDERWNLQTAALDYREIYDTEKRLYIKSIQDKLDKITDGPHIFHYTQGRKPWHPFCPHPYSKFFHKYFWSSKYFQKSYRYFMWYIINTTKWMTSKLFNYIN